MANQAFMIHTYLHGVIHGDFARVLFSSGHFPILPQCSTHACFVN